jgi:hypothetical protein
MKKRKPDPLPAFVARCTCGAIIAATVTTSRAGELSDDERAALELFGNVERLAGDEAANGSEL